MTEREYEELDQLFTTISKKQFSGMAEAFNKLSEREQLRMKEERLNEQSN